MKNIEFKHGRGTATIERKMVPTTVTLTMGFEDAKRLRNLLLNANVGDNRDVYWAAYFPLNEAILEAEGCEVFA